MSYDLTVSLSEQTWQLLQQHAATTGTPPERIVEAAVQEHLAPPRFPSSNAKSEMTEEQKAEARRQFRECIGSVSMGTGADNDGIDADLAREVLTAHMQKTDMTEEEQATARQRFERHFGAVDLGYPTGTDNESIDADLAREYGSTHERD